MSKLSTIVCFFYFCTKHVLNKHLFYIMPNPSGSLKAKEERMNT